MRILSRFSLLNWFDSRLHLLVIASKLLADNTPTKASGSIVISTIKSSPSRKSRHHTTHWCCWIVGYHFYGVCDLNTITIYPANLKLLLYFHTSQHTSKNSNSCDTNTPQRALTTRFTQRNRPESKPLFVHHHVNNCFHQTIVSTECGDRLRQIGQGQRTRRFVAFERMRSLDECRVADRSRKVDFLSGNERCCVIELMRVAR